MPSKSFWNGKRVFLTGHTGFKGAWLSLFLKNLGAALTGFALKPPTQPSLFEVADLSEGMTSILGDIRDASALQLAMQQAAPEIVIHMAAQSLVKEGYKNPAETYSTNVIGTVHLLEAVRKTSGVRVVVNVTSDKCYENREWSWGYRENEAMGGYDPYSSSKGCAELVTSAYRRSYLESAGVALASARAGNVIGGGDWAADRLVPDILRAIECGLPVNIRSPHAIRPWQHVLEPLSGYLVLAERLYSNGTEFAEGWNFGPADEDARPVQSVVEKLTSLWGDGAAWQIDRNPHPHEAHYLKLDCSKARTRLGWRQKWNLDQALASIVDWHKAYRAGEDMKSISLQQIGDFMSGEMR